MKQRPASRSASPAKKECFVYEKKKTTRGWSAKGWCNEYFRREITYIWEKQALEFTRAQLQSSLDRLNIIDFDEMTPTKKLRDELAELKARTDSRIREILQMKSMHEEKLQDEVAFLGQKLVEAKK